MVDTDAALAADTTGATVTALTTGALMPSAATTGGSSGSAGPAAAALTALAALQPGSHRRGVVRTTAAGAPDTTLPTVSGAARSRGPAEPTAARPGITAGSSGATVTTSLRGHQRISAVSPGAALPTDTTDTTGTAHTADTLMTSAATTGRPTGPTGTPATTLTALAALQPGSHRRGVVRTTTAGAPDTTLPTVSGATRSRSPTEPTAARPGITAGSSGAALATGLRGHQRITTARPGTALPTDTAYTTGTAHTACTLMTSTATTGSPTAATGTAGTTGRTLTAQAAGRADQARAAPAAGAARAALSAVTRATHRAGRAEESGSATGARSATPTAGAPAAADATGQPWVQTVVDTEAALATDATTTAGPARSTGTQQSAQADGSRCGATGAACSTDPAERPETRGCADAAGAA